jgi:hypothetical protein
MAENGSPASSVIEGAAVGSNRNGKNSISHKSWVESDAGKVRDARK